MCVAEEPVCVCVHVCKRERQKEMERKECSEKEKESVRTNGELDEDRSLLPSPNFTPESQISPSVATEGKWGLRQELR